ncbi:MAG: hypothetical protein LDLANPLL_02196 [Turneriella sp.]|nr:hypothetical protein [Turneriella sp.]
MTRFFWAFSYGVLLALIPLQLVATTNYIHKVKPRVLTTPHSLAVVPLTFDAPDEARYLKPLESRVENVQKLRYWQALLPIYAAAFFFWITGIFLYVFARVKRIERAYILFCVFVTAYLLLFVDFITAGYTRNFFFAYNIIIIAPFLYLYRSVYALETRGFIYPIIMALGIAAYFIFPIRSVQDELFFIHLLGAIFSITFIYCAYLFFRAEKSLKKSEDNSKPWVARAFNLSLIFSIALPPAFFFTLYYFPVPIDINYNALFFLPALFPMIFFTLSLRWGFVSFHVPISLTLVRLLYFAFFGFLYWFTIGFSLGEILHGETIRIGHFLLLAFFLLLIDPLRTALLTSLDSFAYARRKNFENFLSQSFQQITNPRRVNQIVESIATLLREGLGAIWVRIVISNDVFRGWMPKNDKVLFLSPDDPFWLGGNRPTRKGRLSVLTRTFIGPVRDFLQKHGGYLVITIGKFKAGILIAERQGNMPYYSEDMRFLKRAAAEVEALIQNYVYLVDSLKLKRRERELADNARIQQRIIPGYKEFQNFIFHSYSHAYESVTGDYIDLIETKPETHIVFLGDVSGHGISSGYLVAFARAYLRGSLVLQKQTLSEAIDGLNNYLARNYRGNEFITLFSLEMQFSKDSLTLNYINAGQHPILMYQNGTLTPLDDSQKLLGVIEAEYKTSSITLKKSPVRLLLYSDGAFDVFNKAGKHLGYKKFFEWVTASLSLGAAEQLTYLRQKIETYTGSGYASDDLALIIIEIR